MRVTNELPDFTVPSGSISRIACQFITSRFEFTRRYALKIAGDAVTRKSIRKKKCSHADEFSDTNSSPSLLQTSDALSKMVHRARKTLSNKAKRRNCTKIAIRSNKFLLKIICMAGQTRSNTRDEVWVFPIKNVLYAQNRIRYRGNGIPNIRFFNIHITAKNPKKRYPISQKSNALLYGMK